MALRAKHRQENSRDADIFSFEAAKMSISHYEINETRTTRSALLLAANQRIRDLLPPHIRSGTLTLPLTVQNH